MPDIKKIILIIDDDEDDCTLVQESLQQMGMNHSVQYLLGAEEALEYLRDIFVLPSLIILDVNMPKMNGLELLKVIKSKYSIPVILYTTSCSDELIGEAKQLGAIDCVKKGTSYADNTRFAKMILEMLEE